MTTPTLRRIGGVALAVALLAGCAGSDDPAATDGAPTTATPAATTTSEPGAAAGGGEALDVTYSEAPGDLGDVAFTADLRCGDAERNVVDVAVPGDPATFGDGPADTPLVVHVHGGGFVQGDKGGLWDGDEAPIVRTLLDNGVAVASMNYTLLTGPEDGGVRTSIDDVAACFQFLRHHGPATFGIDPDNIAARGGSAGAGSVLWLAYHDDIADPEADDPVFRESSKPVAVAARATQATYDLERWSTDVFGDYDEMFGERDLFELAQIFGLDGMLLNFYGLSDAADLAEPETAEYRAEVDLLDLMDADDPPVWVENTSTSDETPLSVDLLFHHGHHARAIERQAEKVGADAIVTFGPGATPAVAETDFLLEALGVR